MSQAATGFQAVSYESVGPRAGANWLVKCANGNVTGNASLWQGCRVLSSLKTDDRQHVLRGGPSAHHSRHSSITIYLVLTWTYPLIINSSLYAGCLGSSFH